MTGTMLKEARQLAMHVGGYHKEVMDALVNRLEKWESVFGHLGEPDEVGNEWRALSDRLEAAEKGVALLERLVDARGSSLNAVANERDALRTALEKIADWDSAWGPFPETNEAWRAMAIVTAREAVPRQGEKK